MRVADLFCGAGGFSTGFLEAGFEVAFAVDNWPKVEETYRANHPGTDFLLEDVTDLDPTDLPHVDVVIGSPPCPEFSVANKKRDPVKGMVLVREFERVVEALAPRYFVMENVPPVERYLSSSVYPRVRVLNAADFGVPQIRRRCFAGRFPLPRPTHGRSPSRTLDGRRVRSWITVREALHDGFQGGEYLTRKQVERMKYLRSAKPHLKTKGAPDGTMEFPDRVDRPARTLTSFAGGISREGFVFDEADLGRTFGTGPRHPPQELDRPARTIKTSPGREDSALALDRPAFTIAEPYLTDPRRLRNPIGVTRPTGQNEKRLRRLSLRECATLQSFPDSFTFHGSRTARYRMVGNAVPPLLARRIAEGILREEGGQTRLDSWSTQA